MGTYDGDLYEVFTPPDDWRPGVEAEKKVKINNKGTVDFIAVARFDESCIRREDVILKKYDAESGSLQDVKVADAGEELAVIFTDEKGKTQDVGIKKFGSEAVPYEEGVSPEDYAGKWVYFKDTSDEKHVVYYFLYAGIIPAGQESPYILESVTMNPLLESMAAKTHQVSYYDKDSGKEVYSFSYDLSKYGYDSTHYSIQIKSDTIQATRAAIANGLAADGGMVPPEFSDLLIYLQDICKK